MKHRNALACILPYAIWMLLMAALPSTAWAYAVRSAVCLAFLVPALYILFRAKDTTALPDPPKNNDADFSASAIFIGIIAGLIVWAAWVLPEFSAFYREWLVVGDAATQTGPSPYEPAVCGWTLTLVRLAGSSFVIAAAEELFFRRWLYEWLGADAKAFLWMLVLFAIEHNRPAVAVVAGAVYGILAIRSGLSVAIIAHATTNFALGLQVIITGNWAFW